MRILVTGAARDLGGHVARRLAEREDVEAIYGLDVRDPRVDLGRTEFVHADTRHSLLTKLIRGLGVDTVIHCAVPLEGRESGRTLHETVVIGTMNLLAACAGRDSPVRRLVVKSSVHVYGCRSYAPSFLREEEAGREAPTDAVGREVREMEQLVWDFAIRHPGAAVTVLRLGRRLGIGDPTPLGEYFQLSPVPTFLGFDPRIQLLHEEDAVEGLHRAATADHPGVFNLAGEGVLLLSQAVRLARRDRLPVLLPYLRVLARAGLRVRGFDMPASLADLLTHGCVVDTSALEAEFGWRPAHTTRETLSDFVRGAARGFEARALGPQEYELSKYLQQRRRGGRPVRTGRA